MVRKSIEHVLHIISCAQQRRPWVLIPLRNYLLYSPNALPKNKVHYDNTSTDDICFFTFPPQE